MHCPIDNAQLGVMVRQGIEIDFCPLCRGVWLDRGELEKIVARVESFSAISDTDEEESQAAPTRENIASAHLRTQNKHDREYIRASQPKHRRRDTFLEEIFDF